MPYPPAYHTGFARHGGANTLARLRLARRIELSFVRTRPAVVRRVSML
jgi:hypothetical protein